MLVSCRPLFMGETDRLPLDAALDFSQVEFQGSCPFPQPIRVTGEIVNRAGIVRLTGHARFVWSGACDRCLTPFERTYDVPLDHVLVTTVENEDSDFILLDDYRLPLDDLVQADVFLDLPYKNLCREDCRGICPRCGRNRNTDPCDCSDRAEDPRLAVLKQLLN